MISDDDIQIAKTTLGEILQKMTLLVSALEVVVLKEDTQMNAHNILHSIIDTTKEKKSAGQALEVNITMEDPQFLIGQNGQTLFELQRIVKLLLNKKLQKVFYVQLDINGYKKKKVEHLKRFANGIANEVAETHERKILPPMSAYERKVVHGELSKRSEVTTQSQGDGQDRYIVVSPR